MTQSYVAAGKADLMAARDEKLRAGRVQAASLAADVRWLMEDKRGRNIVFWLLSESGLFQDSFDGNGLRFAHNTGRQWLGREIHNTVLAECPDLFVMLMQEHASGITADNGRARN